MGWAVCSQPVHAWQRWASLQLRTQVAPPFGTPYQSPGHADGKRGKHTAHACSTPPPPLPLRLRTPKTAVVSTHLSAGSSSARPAAKGARGEGARMHVKGIHHHG